MPDRPSLAVRVDEESFDRLAGLELGELEEALAELTAVLTRRPGCRVERILLDARGSAAARVRGLADSGSWTHPRRCRRCSSRTDGSPTRSARP